MANIITTVFKILYLSMFFLNMLLILPNINLGVMLDVTRPLSIITYLVLILGLLATAAAQYITFAVFMIFGSQAAQSGAEAMGRIAQAAFPGISSSAVAANWIDDLVLSLSVILTLILIPGAILSALGFIIRGETKLAIYSFLCFNFLLSLAMYTTTSMSKNIYLDLSLPPSNAPVFAILFSPVFVLGLLLYLMLEFSFQASYTINLLQPMAERQERITKHLKRVESYVPPAATAESQSARVTVQQQKKFDVLAASYLREMIEKKVFKKGEMELSGKALSKLQGYVNNVKLTDRKFTEKITARAAAPDARRIVRGLIPTIVLRMVLVIFFSVFLLNPSPILELLQTLGIIYFPQLIASIELSQPEFRTAIIFNIILIVFLASTLMHYFNKRMTKEVEGEIQHVDTLADFSAAGIEQPDTVTDTAAADTSSGES